MFQVEKRDGKLVSFDINKIKTAIKKAFSSLKLDTDDSIIDLLALRVTSDFQDKIKNHAIQVEEIQDSVEKILSETGYYQVAKAYILYRKQRENVRDISNTVKDYKNIVDSYLSQSTAKKKEGSLELYSVGGLILSNSGAITQNYWLNEVYDEQISQAHLNGDIYIHDLDMLTADRAGWSLHQFLLEGLGGVKENVTSRPAKHLFALANQLVNFLGIMQNEWAGAQSLTGFDTYLAPFIKVDGLSENEVHKCIETFIYGVNIPSRWGTQSPFSNIGFDWIVPEELKDTPCIVGGQPQDFTYKDCQKEMCMIQRVFLDILIHGDQTGRGFKFPIPTISITKDFDFENGENNDLLFELAAKYGTPYFANCIATNRRPIDLRESFDNEFKEDILINKSGGLFAYGENTGNIGTVTINMPRIAYLSENKEDFFQKLDYLMDLSARSLHVKRQVLDKFLNGGLYPYTKRYIQTFDHHFSTIGLIGMNEAGINAKWLQASLLKKETQDFCEEVLLHMKKRLLEYQHEYHELFNLEATPAEHVTYRFQKKDHMLYPDIQADQYYTNSAILPVDAKIDVFEALEIEERFQSLYTGGTVFDVYLNKRIFDSKAIKNLIKLICTKYKVPYFTLSPAYSICKEHGYINGKQSTCPVCGKKSEVWARVSGYYRPVDRWNDAKKQEFEKRNDYNIG